MCKANKGAAGAELGMTNLYGDWLDTMYQHDPWDTQPALSRINGFHIKMVAPDMLHVWHIGHGRDFLASVIVHLLVTGAFGAGKRAVQEANNSLHAFVQEHKLPQVKVTLSRESLTWHEFTYPHLNLSKASQVGVVHKWLANLAVTGVIVDSLVATAVWSSHKLLETVVGGPICLDPVSAASAHAHGMMYLLSYVRLGATSLADRKLLWFVRPKFHMIHHIVLSLQSRPSSRNPHLDSVWMDEDFVGTILKLMKIIHPMLRARRTLQRWLLGLTVKLRNS